MSCHPLLSGGLGLRDGRNDDDDKLRQQSSYVDCTSGVKALKEGMIVILFRHDLDTSRGKYFLLVSILCSSGLICAWMHARAAHVSDFLPLP